MYYLFLDDVRNPVDVTWVELPQVEWVIVRNYNEFKNIIELHGLPEFVAFDHDIEADIVDGDVRDLKNCKVIRGKTGHDCAKYLVNVCLAAKLPFPKYVVHSVNPPGKDAIISYIESYKKHYGCN